MHVRPPTTDDIPFLVDATLLLAEESEGRCPDADAVRVGLHRALEDGTARYFLAEDPARPDDGLAPGADGTPADASPVGCLFVTREWSDWSAGWYWWIQGVYVVPQARRRGVFRALLDAVRRAAAEAGDVREVRLYVHKDNEGARRCYEALGFRTEPYVVMATPVR